MSGADRSVTTPKSSENTHSTPTDTQVVETGGEMAGLALAQQALSAAAAGDDGNSHTNRASFRQMPSALQRQAVLGMQQRHGNAAVQRMLAANTVSANTVQRAGGGKGWKTVGKMNFPGAFEKEIPFKGYGAATFGGEIEGSLELQAPGALATTGTSFEGKSGGKLGGDGSKSGQREMNAKQKIWTIVNNQKEKVAEEQAKRKLEDLYTITDVYIEGLAGIAAEEKKEASGNTKKKSGPQAGIYVVIKNKAGMQYKIGAKAFVNAYDSKAEFKIADMELAVPIEIGHFDLSQASEYLSDMRLLGKLTFKGKFAYKLKPEDIANIGRQISQRAWPYVRSAVTSGVRMVATSLAPYILPAAIGAGVIAAAAAWTYIVVGDLANNWERGKLRGEVIASMTNLDGAADAFGAGLSSGEAKPGMFNFSRDAQAASQKGVDALNNAASSLGVSTDDVKEMLAEDGWKMLEQAKANFYSAAVDSIRKNAMKFIDDYYEKSWTAWMYPKSWWQDDINSTIDQYKQRSKFGGK